MLVCDVALTVALPTACRACPSPTHTHAQVRGNLRGFLQSERVKYIRQTEEDVEGEDVVTPAPGAKAL